MLLRVVDELGADKALGVLAHILQLSLSQGEELETMEDRNCQGLVCLSVPAVECARARVLLKK